MFGDTLSTALARFGITEARVAAYLGKPCNCSERREKLNRLDLWFRRVLAGKLDGAVGYLERILGE